LFCWTFDFCSSNVINPFSFKNRAFLLSHKRFFFHFRKINSNFLFDTLWTKFTFLLCKFIFLQNKNIQDAYILLIKWKMEEKISSRNS
jgi:hypothetical protein